MGGELRFSLDALLRIPDWAKAGGLLALSGLLVGAFGWLVYWPHSRQVAEMESQIQTLKAQYQRKKRYVVHLPRLEKRYRRLRERMQQAQAQLPKRTEVARFLVEVTRAGRSEGLSFELVRPRKAIPKRFYAEWPVEIKVTGPFNALGHFLAATASLPRILSFGDITLSRSGQELVLKGLARTYRYLDEEQAKGGGEGGE